LGVRTATDLINCTKEINDFNDRAKDDKYKSIVDKLDVIVAALKDDEWLNYVQNWRSYSSSQEKAIDDPFKFYETAANSHQTWVKSTKD
jgi:hypothetical protein